MQPLSADSAEPSPAQKPLPAATVGGMAGLLEILDDRGGRGEIPELTRQLTFSIQDVTDLIQATEMLGLAIVHGTSIELTDQGRLRCGGHRYPKVDLRPSGEG